VLFHILFVIDALLSDLLKNLKFLHCTWPTDTARNNLIWNTRNSTCKFHTSYRQPTALTIVSCSSMKKIKNRRSQEEGEANQKKSIMNLICIGITRKEQVSSRLDTHCFSNNWCWIGFANHNLELHIPHEAGRWQPGCCPIWP
jgi:hypothetical protein